MCWNQYQRFYPWESFVRNSIIRTSKTGPNRLTSKAKSPMLEKSIVTRCMTSHTSSLPQKGHRITVKFKSASSTHVPEPTPSVGVTPATLVATSVEATRRGSISIPPAPLKPITPVVASRRGVASIPSTSDTPVPVPAADTTIAEGHLKAQDLVCAPCIAERKLEATKQVKKTKKKVHKISREQAHKVLTHFPKDPSCLVSKVCNITGSLYCKRHKRARSDAPRAEDLCVCPNR